MPDHPSPLLAPGVEATFVAAATIRDGRLAIWDRRALVEPPRASGGPRSIQLITPAGAGVRERAVEPTWLTVPEAIDALASITPDTDVSASVRAWSTATRLALHLVARGRLLPTADTDGTDLWRAGPLDANDLDRWATLAEALPAAAHATEVPGSAPRRVSSPAWLLARFRDAVVDSYVRTAGAVDACGHDAFASTRRTKVAGSAGWLVATGTAADATVSVDLRIEVDDASMLADHHRETDREPHDPFDAEPDGFRATVQVSSLRDPSLTLDADAVWSAPRAVAARFGDGVEEQVLLALRRGARAWAPLHRMLDADRPATIDLTLDEVDELLGPAAAGLAGAGVNVLWPAGLLRGVQVAPTVSTVSMPTGDRRSSLALASICELRWAATIDGDELTDEEIAELAAAKRSVIRMRGQWIKVDESALSKLRGRTTISAGAALAAALGDEVLFDGDLLPVEVEGPIAELAERLRSAEEREDIVVPADLDAELRPYQVQGLRWLANMAGIGLGGILADDMGLGKTVQFIALHLLRRSEGQPTLVVCPVSVIANWQREINRFAPGIEVRRYHANTRDLTDLPSDAIVLTTYGVVRRQASELAEIEWGLVGADEAQNMKNPMSRTAKSMRTIPALARFALTGTPVENRLLDLWSLLDWTTPGLLGTQERFRYDIAVPIERDHDPETTEAFARMVRPFVLRRRKVDPGIAPELPPKTETDEVVGLTTEQATLYTALVDDVMSQVEDSEGIARRGLVLKLLTGLKQICNHPAHFLRQDGPLPGRSGKLDAVTDLVETIVDEDQSVLLFTQFVAMGHLLVSHLARPDRPVEFLHGGVSASGREAMVDRFQAGEVPVLVVSLKAGGTGLNLTQATHVIHVDRWWNPAVEDQASDRAWRIGQDRPVQIHRMICEGTVEDRVAQLLIEKRDLANSVVGAGEGWVGELSDSDLRTLVSLGTDR